MKTCLVTLSLMAVGAAVASPASEQASPPVAAAATRPLAETPVKVAASSRSSTATLPVMRRVTAAGSVLVLTDGVVSSAAIAQIHSPAPGFVYER